MSSSERIFVSSASRMPTSSSASIRPIIAPSSVSRTGAGLVFVAPVARWTSTAFGLGTLASTSSSLSRSSSSCRRALPAGSRPTRCRSAVDGALHLLAGDLGAPEQVLRRHGVHDLARARLLARGGGERDNVVLVPVDRRCLHRARRPFRAGRRSGQRRARTARESRPARPPCPAPGPGRGTPAASRSGAPSPRSSSAARGRRPGTAAPAAA